MAVEHTYKICNVEYTRELTPMKAIRAHCRDCSGDSNAEIRECGIRTCPLWPFRLGKNPGVARNMSDEAKKAAADRLKKWREGQNASL